MYQGINKSVKEKYAASKNEDKIVRLHLNI